MMLTRLLSGEMQAIVRAAAGPVQPGEQVCAQINRAARRLAIGHTRAREFWYGRARRVLADEADQLRAWRAGQLARERDRMAAELAAMDREEARLRDLLDQMERGYDR